MDRTNRLWVAGFLSDPCGEGLSPVQVCPGTWIRMRRAFLLLVVGLLVMAVGCARPRVEYEEIFRDDRVHVRLAEKRDKSGVVVPRGFEHPWDVETGTLDDMLESVLYKKGKVYVGGSKTEDAFPAFPRHALLEPVQKAFAQAHPDQVVDFSFVERRSTLKIFRRAYMTDGIMFRKQGRLNIAFRNLAFEEVGGAEEDDYEPNRNDPTESPMRTSWTLVAGDGQALARGKGTGPFGSNTYTNWIQLDLSWPWGVSDEAIMEEAMPGMGEALESLTEGEYELPMPGDTVTDDVRERLEFLEELRRDGTISEEAYREKKRELMHHYENLPE
jgi:hypothetical protein